MIERGKGCHVWDLDGNEFVEYGMGLRAVSLGHGYPDVVRAVTDQLEHGTNFTRPSPVELECAEMFLDLIRGADMVKFCKDGSSANSAALRLARAHTGRDLVAICADQPFFSYDDWFIATTAMNAGIPAVIRDLVLTFRYNDLASAEELFEAHPDRIACVLLEAERTEPPRPGYLHGLRALCQRHGALFVLDEMITGFRWRLGGAQAEFELDPDLSTFGKAMANGFSVSAIAGKREIMRRGGLRHDEERVFLLSTTHGAETHALAAALATMSVYRDQPVIETMYARGDRLRAGLNAAAEAVGVEEFFTVLGRTPNLVYATRDIRGNPSQEFRTLFLQEMIARGVLAPSLVVSYSHSEDDIDRTIEAAREALAVYRAALDEGIGHYLNGRPVRPVDRPFS
jgi:glutamate-1-semialdehyde 2,1-aminomutase